MSQPRRSPRLSQQYSNELRFQSTSPTSLPSSTALSTVSTTSKSSPDNAALAWASCQPEQPRLQLPSQISAAYPPFTAPRPSPSADDRHSFLERSQSRGSFAMAQQVQHNSMQHFPPQQSQQQQPQSQLSQHAYAGTQARAQHHLHPDKFSQSGRTGLNGGDSGQLPPGFLAEAARRAQMACLVRDLSDVTL